MNAETVSITSTLRKFRASGADAYLDELVNLADLDGTTHLLDQAEHVFALRARIGILQQRVRELEAAK